MSRRYTSPVGGTTTRQGPCTSTKECARTHRPPRTTAGNGRSYAGVDFGDDAVVDLASMMLRWFGHWLRDDDTGLLDELSSSRIFVTGQNRWREDPDWPPPSTSAALYLHSAGAA